MNNRILTAASTGAATGTAPAPDAAGATRRACLHGAAAWALLAAGCSSSRTAPTFNGTLLDGRSVSSADLRGKVVLVNFWATSCASCVRKMPQLVALHQAYAARGFETLAVAMRHDPPAYVAHFAQSRQLPFGVAIDNTGAIARSFGDVRATPTTFVIDRQGRIVQQHQGDTDFAALHRLVRRLLDQA